MSPYRYAEYHRITGMTRQSPPRRASIMAVASAFEETLWDEKLETADLNLTNHKTEAAKGAVNHFNLAR